MNALTIRGIEPEIAEKLKSTAAKEGKSINQLTLEIIREDLGISKENKRLREYDDLDDLFGRWSEDEFREIDSKINRERQREQEIWE